MKTTEERLTRLEEQVKKLREWRVEHESNSPFSTHTHLLKKKVDLHPNDFRRKYVHL